MEDKPKKDLLLAKRRIIVISPLLLILFIFSINMVVFSAILSERFKTIQFEYTIKNSDYEIKNSETCKKISKEIENNNNNFTKVFELETKMKDIIGYSETSMGFSINGIVFSALLLLICLFLTYKYVRPSDEAINSDPSFAPNRKHPGTTCFLIVRIITFSFIDLFLIIFLSLLNSNYKKTIFKKLYNFTDQCIINKENFKNKYSYCWSINGILNKYKIFTVLFFFVDLISFILSLLAENYNVWTFLLSKITFGNFRYKEVEAKKGYLIPQSTENENDKKDDTEGIICSGIETPENAKVNNNNNYNKDTDNNSSNISKDNIGTINDI